MLRFFLRDIRLKVLNKVVRFWLHDWYWFLHCGLLDSIAFVVQFSMVVFRLFVNYNKLLNVNFTSENMVSSIWYSRDFNAS